MAIIDEAYLRAVLPAEDFRKAFDRNGTGTADSAHVTLCINIAESTAYTQLNGGRSVTVPLTAVVDESIKVQLARMALYEAVRWSASDGVNGAKSPYRQAYDDACAFFKAWKMDQVRPVTANGGVQPSPRAAVYNLDNTDGGVGGVYDRAARGTDRTGF